MEEFLQLLLGPLGLTIFVLFVLFSGWKGMWRFGRDYDRMEEKNEKEIEFWREAALRGTELAEKAVTLREETHGKK